MVKLLCRFSRVLSHFYNYLNFEKSSVGCRVYSVVLLIREDKSREGGLQIYCTDFIFL